MALRVVVRNHQRAYFTPEKLNPLKQLNVFSEDNGILRCRCRLGKADINFGTKHPMLIASKLELARAIAHQVENMKSYKATEAKLDTLNLKQEPLATRLTQMEKEIKEKLSPTSCGEGQAINDSHWDDIHDDLKELREAMNNLNISQLSLDIRTLHTSFDELGSRYPDRDTVVDEAPRGPLQRQRDATLGVNRDIEKEWQNERGKISSSKRMNELKEKSEMPAEGIKTGTRNAGPAVEKREAKTDAEGDTRVRFRREAAEGGQRKTDEKTKFVSAPQRRQTILHKIVISRNSIDDVVARFPPLDTAHRHHSYVRPQTISNEAQLQRERMVSNIAARHLY
ncbi:unnamed protein product [Heligmosomoides polygyrus]|uniref:Uncharacterized protein n=1 Tax=Heligmosomoides polygyrus TaxID=6339 RepID=A0A183GI84_HELPZ|nr:unnamed protein product [Heligmosomoides polygyrus]